MELTDLQLCEEIAKIEGYVKCKIKGLLILPDIENDSIKKGIFIDNILDEYNPLTDDALWVSLILKYEVSINFHFCLLSIVTDKYYEKNFQDIPSLKRNALLLIIEAHPHI